MYIQTAASWFYITDLQYTTMLWLMYKTTVQNYAAKLDLRISYQFWQNPCLALSWSHGPISQFLYPELCTMLNRVWRVILLIRTPQLYNEPIHTLQLHLMSFLVRSIHIILYSHLSNSLHNYRIDVRAVSQLMTKAVETLYTVESTNTSQVFQWLGDEVVGLKTMFEMFKFKLCWQSPY